jgi:[acyl-carrier-protein] S-malonyltransferase
MICWMFPGQPLRHTQPFPDDADVREIIALCGRVTGFDPQAWQGGDSLASEHVRLQVYGNAMSLYRTRRLRTNGERPGVVAEHSMGIYAALAACGCITEQDALEMTARIGSCVATMSARADYALGCVIGLEGRAVESAAANNGVYVANYNTSRHFLLSGERVLIKAAMAECQAAGAFSVSIHGCDAPLHSPLLEEVADDLWSIFSDYRYAEPGVPLVEHIGQKRLAAARVPGFLLDDLLRPVWWERTYRVARAMGATHFIELGAGDALKKFNRWIESAANEPSNG